MVDLSKPVQTRDGRAVRILATGIKNARYPVAAVVTDRDGREFTETFTAAGTYRDGGCMSEYDLVNVPEKRRLHCFLNVYPDGVGSFSPDRAEADRRAGPDRITCVEVDQEYEVPVGSVIPAVVAAVVSAPVKKPQSMTVASAEFNGNFAKTVTVERRDEGGFTVTITCPVKGDEYNYWRHVSGLNGIICRIYNDKGVTLDFGNHESTKITNEAWNQVKAFMSA